ncbi:hypothetical protein PHMEG_00036151 [Phytophthora megakarya]|uniref:RxLR effector protein n=1 Tax=Phytophthora megakarya TaxID=4795 RepID=A0A225UMN9_9STRA|nr:hypothetical protein PHMEG_00036151 [Phytophthora megakarya]
MRLLNAIFLLAVGTLGTSTSMVLATKSDSKPTNLESIHAAPLTTTEDIPGGNRFLRLAANIENDNNAGHSVESTVAYGKNSDEIGTDSEERGFAGWSVDKIFTGIELVAGRSGTDKLKKKFVEFMRTKLLKMGKTPNDILGLANAQTNPAKRAMFERQAKVYADWLKKRNG